MSVEMIRALSEPIGALIWPAIVIIVLFVFRSSMKNILANLEETSLAGGFAVEYQRIRATLSGGTERTRMMQEVVAEMCTLALAARSLRSELSELSESRSAGDGVETS